MFTHHSGLESKIHKDHLKISKEKQPQRILDKDIPTNGIREKLQNDQ